LFFEISPKVFRRSFWRVAGLQAKLEWRNWRRELDVVFGDRSLDTPDLVTGLAILVKRIDTGVSWGLANNPRAAYWDTPPDNSYFGNRRYRIADLIQASMAMPTYFEPVELPMITGEGKGLFVDASMGIHNNPSLFLFMMSVLRYYGLCWKTGVDDLTIASIGTGTFRHQLSMGRFNLARQLQLAIHGLTSMMSEADAFILSQMQFLGECPTPWQVNSEIGTLTGERAAPPLFRFFRYDVRLETPWLRDQLGIDMSEQQVVALRAIDDPSSFPRLYEIGTAAAERQVKPEHWLPHPA